jgi:hypothetical protein
MVAEGHTATRILTVSPAGLIFLTICVPLAVTAA